MVLRSVQSSNRQSFDNPRMNNRAVHGFVILIALTLYGCSSTKVKVWAMEDANPIIAPKQISFPTYWEAMQNLDFAYNGEKEEQRTFAEALGHIMAGDIEKAELTMERLSRSSPDSLIRRHARSVFVSLLFSESKWGELLKISSDTVSVGEGNDHVLLTAFSTIPKEEFHFPSEPSTLPIELSSTGSPIVEVELNGQKKRFWLDTGAGLSVVASDIAEACGVSPLGTESIDVGTATTKRVDGFPASIHELKIGGIRIANHPALILKKEDLEFGLFGFITLMKIDGIIGWNLIRHVAMEIDYGKNVLTLKRPVKVPIGNRNFFWLGYPIVRLQSGEGTVMHFGLDTGARTSSIRRNIFTKVTGDTSGRKTTTIGSAGGMEEAEVQVLTRLELILHNARLSFQNISTRPSDPATFVRLDGVLGSDIAKNARFLLDFSNGSVRLFLPEE